MKKIKFRGKRLDNGELIYGDLLHHGKFGVCIREYVIDGFSTLPVDPDSVAQFVGYDADGKEIYEDDELIDEDESPINSLYVGIVDSDSNAIDGEIGTRFSDVWIKKERGGNEKADF